MIPFNEPSTEVEKRTSNKVEITKNDILILINMLNTLILMACFK